MTSPRIFVVDRARFDLPVAPGVDLPTARPYLLLDDDAGECRSVEWRDLEEWHVDRIVEDVRIRPDPFDMAAIDAQTLTLVLPGGVEMQLPLATITDSSETGDYLKKDDVVWPVDEQGALLLNRATTPRLAQLREQLHDLVRELSAQQLELAELVCSFTGILTMYGNMRDFAATVGMRTSTTALPP